MTTTTPDGAPRVRTIDKLRTWRPELQHAEPGPGESLPPGPRTPVAVQSAGLWGARYKYFPAMQRKFGDAFTLHAAPLGRMVVVCDPHDVRAVATGKPDTYEIGATNALFGPLLGRRSLMTLDGVDHRSERARIMPAVVGKHVSAIEELVAQLCEEEVGSWRPGERFRLVDRLRGLALRIIVRVVLGVEELARREELVVSLRRLVDDLGSVELLMWLWPELSRAGRWRRAVEGIDRADDELYVEIERRRRDPDRSERPDFLSVLLDGDPGDELLRDELVTLLGGGFETTAVASTWMFERLSHHPHVLARVRDGLDDPDDPYREAVIKETLRVRSVAFNVGRRTLRPVELGGHLLPTGTFVWPSLGSLHTDPRVWGPDAHLFRPERWLEPDVPTWAYLPFGGGIHRCIGAAFAQSEMDVVLRTVLRHVDLVHDARHDEKATMNGVVVVPRRGVPVHVRTRRPAARPVSSIRPAPSPAASAGRCPMEGVS